MSGPRSSDGEAPPDGSDETGEDPISLPHADDGAEGCDGKADERCNDRLSYDGSPVGHKHPPAKYQFKKGQPKPPGSGRRKRQQNNRIIARKLLEEHVTAVVGGRKRPMTVKEAILRKARAVALASQDIKDHVRFFDLLRKFSPDSVDPPEPLVIEWIPGDEGG